MQSNEYPKQPRSRLPIAIAATIVGLGSVCMCFVGTILGAIAIIFATQADTKYNREDYIGALSSSQVAFVLSVVSLSISILSIFVFLFLWVVSAFTGTSDLSFEIDRTILERLL